MNYHKPEQIKIYGAKYRDTHRSKIREYTRGFRYNLKIETLSHYGTVCQKCGFSDPRALQIDHIEDNGAEERKSLGGQKFSGWQFYSWLKKHSWPSGYQVLCANCNAIKQVEKNARNGSLS